MAAVRHDSLAPSEWQPAIPSDQRLIGLEADLADVFHVHETTVRGRGQVFVFSGRFLRQPEAVFETLEPRFRQRGYIPMLERDGEHDLVAAAPAPIAPPAGRSWKGPVLLAATIASTLLAGTFQALPASTVVESMADLARELVANWRLGIPFTAALLGILGIHELGHYFAARRHGLDVTLPYFIPFPVNLYTGTLGAVIRIRSPFRSRRALFDVGVAGPLAGLAVALPIVAIGLARAEMTSLPAGEGVTVFREPLLFQWMALAIRGPRAPGQDLVMNPLLAAGWWGFFVTALNLLPVSQLDGGHISYAIFGRRHRFVARGAFAAAALVTVAVNPGYLLMLGLVFAMGLEHPPALDALTPIDPRRRLLGLATLVLCLLLITPDPFAFG